MLKYALMAIAAATLVAVVFVFLPTNTGPRPEPRLLNGGDPQSATSFTIHDAPPPTAAATAADPATVAAPPSTGDLDAVMQRLRNSATKPDATASATITAPALPGAPAAGTPPASASAAGSPAAPPPAVTPTPDPAASAPPPPPARWASVTAQGTRWRMARSSNGYTVSIDLGGGQVADVHVLPAFANLDPASVNVRVDYLRDTILQNFSNQSASYSFARDGSVSLER